MKVDTRRFAGTYRREYDVPAVQREDDGAPVWADSRTVPGWGARPRMVVVYQRVYGPQGLHRNA